MKTHGPASRRSTCKPDFGVFDPGFSEGPSKSSPPGHGNKCGGGKTRPRITRCCQACL